MTAKSIRDLFRDFSNSERSGGFVLIICTVLSLLLSNVFIGHSYIEFWHAPLFGETVEYWINDGLMTLFFLLIGLELEREVYIGELANLKRALLPVFAAAGGMIVPAGIYYWLNNGAITASGVGIPMATDIAFALGILSLLGKRVPFGLKIFLTALAVIDDLGAILVIAIFYTDDLVWLNLLFALSILGALFILNRLKVHVMWPYLLGGVIMWFFMLHSGVHATITGVLLAFVIPFGKGGEETVSYKLQHWLHKPVAFLVLPIFAMANTGLLLDENSMQGVFEPAGVGIIAGLVAGKPIGIFLFSLLALFTGVSFLPQDVKWKHVLGAGMLAGIGFTMSIFISLLAFNDAQQISYAKISILCASVVSALLGLARLKITLKKSDQTVTGGT